jgi:DNA-binding Lrp family transcriptional regulator
LIFYDIKKDGGFMDNNNENILNIIQEGIPIESRPFRVIGEELNISEEEVLTRINVLKDLGYIRRFGGIFNSKKLGYTGTLCGIKVPSKRIDEVANIINSYSEVTHNYLRDNDDYNMWFTIIAVSNNDITRIIDEIKNKTGTNDILNVPSKKLYKVKTFFQVGGN